MSVADFAAWDRCITRGLPVSMEPRNYNNGIRIMQSPGYVVILLEMAHEARVIPTNGMPPLDSQIKEWMGESRGHWEGNTLVVETTNFNGLVGHTSAGVPGSPGPLQPETTNQKIVERFTRVAPDTIEFKMTIDGSRGSGDGLLHHRVSDVSRQQVRDVRIRLPRGQHGGAELHRNVALRAPSSEGKEATIVMADGREEREERERRVQEERPQDREDRVERHEIDEWTPERVDS